MHGETIKMVVLRMFVLRVLRRVFELKVDGET
jgi:hypothetical protein